jgi:hypothetical protein
MFMRESPFEKEGTHGHQGTKAQRPLCSLLSYNDMWGDGIAEVAVAGGAADIPLFTLTAEGSTGSTKATRIGGT